MAELAQYSLIGALACIVLALLMNLVVATSRSSQAARPVSAPAPTRVPATVAAAEGGTTAAVLEPEDLEADPGDPAPTPPPRVGKTGLDIGPLANGFTVAAIAFLTAYLVFRTIQLGHLPLVNMSGYASALVWMVLMADLVAYGRFKVRLVSVVSHIVAAALAIFAVVSGFTTGPLIPALQNSMLLTLHVGFAIAGTGVAAVSLGGAVIYLLYPRLPGLKVPRHLFDEIGYKATVVMFPLWTIMLLFGSLWANVAWGSYWSWDPKETAALVTWFVYAGFLHARVVVGWRGTRSAVLLVIGFLAVLFTLFGNYFFGGLHSYA